MFLKKSMETGTPDIPFKKSLRKHMQKMTFFQNHTLLSFVAPMSAKNEFYVKNWIYGTYAVGI